MGQPALRRSVRARGHLRLNGTDHILNDEAHRPVAVAVDERPAIELGEPPRMIHDHPLLPTPRGAACQQIAQRLTVRIAG